MIKRYEFTAYPTAVVPWPVEVDIGDWVRFTDHDAEVTRLQELHRVGTHLSEQNIALIQELSATADALRTERTVLRELLARCAHELMCEINERITAEMRAVPCMQRDYDVAMEPVLRAEALLKSDAPRTAT